MRQTSTTKRKQAVILITSLFFLWGFALNLNPILIPHLKKACQLTDTQSAFIDSASYIAYFLLAIPAGRCMQQSRFGLFSDGGRIFLSIMFPTIFALSVRGLGSKTKEGSSWVIMAIVGGAIFPVFMGQVSDAFNIQIAYSVPAACLLVVLYFAYRNFTVSNVVISTSH